MAIPDELIENRIVAALVLREGIEMTAEDVKERCRGKIPDYMIPDEVVFFEALPHTSSGKISKKEIRALIIDQEGS